MRLGVAQSAQMVGERRRAHAPEVELLAAREDGRRHHLDLGGGEDEDQVRRRLLDDLEQRVERLPRQAVDLVDHHHLVGVARGAVAQALGELAHLLDLGVGRGVDLDHVEVGAGGDLAAGAALVAGIGSGAPPSRSTRRRRSQLSALASTRAAVVLPTPRMPEKR